MRKKQLKEKKVKEGIAFFFFAFYNFCHLNLAVYSQ